MADLHRIPNLNPADLRMAELVFEFVQFLLDDDANLTPAGNLTGAARQRLRARMDELISAEEDRAGQQPVTDDVSADLSETLADTVITAAKIEPAEGS